MKGVRICCTVAPQVSEGIDVLLWGGLYGANRAEVAERLLSEAIERKIVDGIIKLSDLQENRLAQAQR